MLFVIRTSEFWQSPARCSLKVFAQFEPQFFLYIHFGTVVKHVRHSFDFLFCLLSIYNCRKICSETPDIMTCCVFQK